MKKAAAAAFVAAVMLIVPLLCLAGGSGFQNIPGTSGALRQYDGRRQAYYGPDKSFAGAGGFKPVEVISATALFREGDSIYVDLTYYGMARRCVYFSAGALENETVGTADLTQKHPASVRSAVQPLLGPGKVFSPIEQKNENNVRQAVELPAGTAIQALVQTDGWVFAEFDCALGRVRAWIPAETVQCSEKIDAIRIGISTEETRLQNITGQVSGTCPVCGGTRTPIFTVSYLQYDEQYHQCGPVEAEECETCHAQFLVNAGTAPKEPHDFEGDVCTQCGYVKNSAIPCTNCGGVMLPEDVYKSVPYSHETHVTEHWQYYECKGCGYSTDPVIADTQQEEPHQFDADGKCLYCCYYDYGN